MRLISRFLQSGANWCGLGLATVALVLSSLGLAQWGGLWLALFGYGAGFAMGALYGFREDDLIPGVKAFNPLDVLDSALTAWRNKAFQLNTWTV